MINEEEFKAYLKEFELYMQGGDSDLQHIENPEMKLLYAAIMWNQEAVLRAGDYLLAHSPNDPLAILEAMHAAATYLAENYGERDPATRERRDILMNDIHDLQNRIQALQKEGRTSNVFSTWKKKYKTKYDDLADEIAGV